MRARQNRSVRCCRYTVHPIFRSGRNPYTAFITPKTRVVTQKTLGTVKYRIGHVNRGEETFTRGQSLSESLSASLFAFFPSFLSFFSFFSFFRRFRSARSSEVSPSCFLRFFDTVSASSGLGSAFDSPSSTACPVGATGGAARTSLISVFSAGGLLTVPSMGLL